jgi:hypothetical protein
MIPSPGISQNELFGGLGYFIFFCKKIFLFVYIEYPEFSFSFALDNATILFVCRHKLQQSCAGI